MLEAQAREQLLCKDIFVTTGMRPWTYPHIEYSFEGNVMRAGIGMIGTVMCLLLACTMEAQQAARTIEVHAHRFAFVPAEITVNSGESIRLRLVADDVPHSLLVKPLGIDVTATKANPGEITFQAKQPGDYDGRCGRFCGSGHGRMVFTVHVQK